MAVWFGGVVLLARVVLAGPGEEDLVQAVRGFGRISTTAIVATVVSGLVQLFRLDGGSLFSDAHGRVLLFKTVLVAVMLFVGLTARQVAQARLGRAHDLSTITADRLRRAFGTEAVIGLVVLGLSGWLLSFTPAKQPESGGVDYAIVEPFVDPTTGLDLTVSVNRSRVGLNQLRVDLRGPTTGDVTGFDPAVRPTDGFQRSDHRAADPARPARASPCRRRSTCRCRSPGRGRCRSARRRRRAASRRPRRRSTC